HSVKPYRPSLAARTFALNGPSARPVSAFLLIGITVFSRHADKVRAVAPPVGR
ncbi:hypothetical protein C7426_1241, partial [Pantoea ananatis]